jgi:hypothetical protein
MKVPLPRILTPQEWHIQGETRQKLNRKARYRTLSDGSWSELLCSMFKLSHVVGKRLYSRSLEIACMFAILIADCVGTDLAWPRSCQSHAIVHEIDTQVSMKYVYVHVKIRRHLVQFLYLASLSQAI